MVVSMVVFTRFGRQGYGRYFTGRKVVCASVSIRRVGSFSLFIFSCSSVLFLFFIVKARCEEGESNCDKKPGGKKEEETRR